MCIAIAKPANTNIDKSIFLNCWNANSDGAGFMYPENNKVEVKKGFMTFDEFWDAYQIVGQRPAAIHFRIKTHGETTPENTHPFIISENLAFIHNGIINDLETINKDMSDTWHFNEEILKPLYTDDGQFYIRKHNVKLIRKFIGQSKLVFMNSKGQMSIINTQMGEWENGVWYSNSSYKERKPVVYHYGRGRRSSSPAFYKFMGGEWATLKEPAYPTDPKFKKGEVVYVEGVSSNGAMAHCIIHEFVDHRTIEHRRWINVDKLEEVFTYGSV